MLHFVEMITHIKFDGICLVEWTSMRLLQE